MLNYQTCRKRIISSSTTLTHTSKHTHTRKSTLTESKNVIYLIYNIASKLHYIGKIFYILQISF